MPADPSQALADQLRSLDAAGRQSLLSQWVDDPDPTQLVALLAASTDSDETVRRLALQTLEELAAAEALPSVLHALADDVPAVRAAAAAALSAYRGDLSERLGEALTQGPRVARRALLVALREHPAPGALAPLLACLADGEPEVRKEAIVTIGHLRVREVREALRAHLSDPDPGVQLAALSVLAQLDLEASAPDLIAALGAGHWRVRAEAARQLARVAADDARARAIHALGPALGDERWQVRKEVILALGSLRARDAAPRITAELSSPLAELRRSAAGALGRLRASQARPALEALAEDPDAEVRRAAAEALLALRD